ncbi:hypothetical protein LZ554_005427 [Drepanopeziza brunnea f. sp. 'monogermtubi']|nr:hypothetical protein LZ554_005427 [Drepanopeziza brunnea f. sp. 'monogermtubi']
MFRRLEKGLPKDPVYPTDLKGLGYFINEEDEIRNIENPRAYFKFFLTKNERHNNVQREAMNEAIRNIISDRLLALGLEKIRLPLGAAADQPHLPIFVSKDLDKKKHVVVLFYEHTQDIGTFAHRIIGAKGGINEGSAVNLVKYIQAQAFSKDNTDSPGIILANTGQLRWWVRGKKAVTQTSWYSLPQKSAVEPALRFNPLRNSIPGSTTTYEHVETIFNTVIKTMTAPDSRLFIIGVSDGAVQASTFMNANFATWGPRIDAFAALASYFHASEITDPHFADFMLYRARIYVQSQDPAGTWICGEKGDKKFHVDAYGAPVFSSGEPYYSETMLIKARTQVVDWFKVVAGDEAYGNPVFTRIGGGGEEEEEEEPIDAPAWEKGEWANGVGPWTDRIENSQDALKFMIADAQKNSGKGAAVEEVEAAEETE